MKEKKNRRVKLFYLISANEDSIKIKHRYRFNGFTLVELLVVIGILATLMAISVVAWRSMSRRMGSEARSEEMLVMLRQAKTTAQQTGMPAKVEFRNNGKEIQGWLYRMVAEWNFTNGKAKGTLVKGTLHEAVPIAQGAVGGGMDLWPKSGRGYIEAEEPEEFNLDDGGWLEARILLYSNMGTSTVFSKDGSYQLLLINGTPRAEIKGSKGGFLSPAGWRLNSGTDSDKSPPKAWRLSTGRWIKIVFAWDESGSVILVDDAMAAQGPGFKAMKSDNPFQIGADNNNTLRGRVDEVRVAAASPARKITVRDSRTLVEHNAQPWNAVVFHPYTGRLDPRYHSGPIEIKFISETLKKQRRISISPLGEMKRSGVEKLEEKEEE